MSEMNAVVLQFNDWYRTSMR